LSLYIFAYFLETFLYYSPIIKKCQALVVNEKTNEIVKKCNIDKSLIYNYVSTKLRYVGEQTIEKYLLSLPEIIKEKKEKYLYYYLLKSSEKMLQQGLVHHNLKEDNIMIDEQTFIPIIVNFQFSFEIKNIIDNPLINKLTQVFYTTEFYPYWCIEMHVLSHAVQIIKTQKHSTIIKEKEMHKIINNYFDKLQHILTKYSNKQLKNLSDLKKKQKDFFQKFIGKHWEKILKELLTYDIVSTWDNYSLAMTFILMSNNLLLLSIWKEIIESIPTERMNLIKTLEKIHL
jgi:hypothetical protein